MYATRTRKVKTDRRDARALTEANVLGAYRPAHRLSDGQRHVRAQLAVRDTLVRTRTRCIALTRALLRQHGYAVPTGGAARPPGACGPPGTWAAALGGGAITGADAHGQRPTERTARPRSFPPVTRPQAVSTADGAQHRLRYGVVSWQPWTTRGGFGGRTRWKRTSWNASPWVMEHGGEPAAGRITKTGNTRMRWLLIQAALSIMRLRDPRAAGLRAWALRIAARGGRHGGGGRVGPPPGRHSLGDAAGRSRP